MMPDLLDARNNKIKSDFFCSNGIVFRHVTSSVR